MIDILTRAQIQKAERYTIDDLHVSQDELMEKAGHACFQDLKSKNVLTLPIHIFAGVGNNGGDALVVARYLLEEGLDVKVWIVQDAGSTPSGLFESQVQKIKPELMQTLQSTDQLERVMESIDQAIMVDGLFGIGLNRPLQGFYLDAISCLNAHCQKHSLFVYAIDVPSGLDVDKGADFGALWKASCTGSFSFAKRGFYQGQGLESVGEVRVLDIGLVRNFPIQSFEVQKSDLSFAPTQTYQHKGQKGHALIFAGSREKSGAAVLSALACHKSNVGRTTLATSDRAHDIIKVHLIDVMSEALPDALESDAVKLLLEDKTALLFGPGLADSNWTDQLLDFVVGGANAPLVVDAQGLHAIKKHLKDLHRFQANVVLTPHPKEMAMLMDTTIQEVLAKRFDLAVDLATRYGVWVVLKGEKTLIANPNAEVYINPTGDQTLSVAGTGDILAGLMVSFLAQGMSMKEAVLNACWMHGSIAQKRGKATHGHAIMASELLVEIESFFKQ